ncbi:MAG: YtxH domain-containing protein [Caldiserica bacterium]|jgi:gas vesicle protein|nr:YtxH domain-containing protein [Caldisericota bacterium]MDH7562216.1 YtxH domain-containing protein [Caldisericota bacterium]
MKKFLLGFAIGAGFGAAMGLLFAPKEGKKTREELFLRLKEACEKGKEAFQKTREEMMGCLGK